MSHPETSRHEIYPGMSRAELKLVILALRGFFQRDTPAAELAERLENPRPPAEYPN